MENRLSNCPDLPIRPHGQYLLQHRTYQDRLDAAQIVMDYMTPEADNGWQWPFDDLLIDAPNNLMYEHYFMRPAGIVVINCDGVVVARGDWFGSWLNNGENQTILENLIDDRNRPARNVCWWPIRKSPRLRLHRQRRGWRLRHG